MPKPELILIQIMYNHIVCPATARDATAEIAPFDPDAGTWDPAATLVSVLSVVSGAAAQAFATPVDTFQKSRAEWSATESAVVMQWAALFAPWLLNVVFFCGTKKKAIASSRTPLDPRCSPCAGCSRSPWASPGRSAGTTATTPRRRSTKRSGSSAPFPVAAKVLLMPKNSVATTILVVIDGVCDMATGALTLAAGDVSAERRRLGAGPPTAAT